MNGSDLAGSRVPSDDENAEVDSLSIQDIASSERLVVLEKSDQLIELQTILKDRSTDHSHFVFCADRLMRLVIEEGLNLLPYTEKTVMTPKHCPYHGIQFARGNCGVALCRSGEAMEIALRQCCRSIRICKMLLGDEQRVLYARLTSDIATRRCLLLYPILTTGLTALKAVATLIADSDVLEENIYLISLFASPKSIRTLRDRYPDMCIITSEITNEIIHNFATKYFGTD
ncbi:unnamed protein product, partial [Mesorhabditis belari]|uniref:Uracil phosphoribosyltransferase n=1 Tax=Mesorhabditis belari TaxID=2138241 RepID=A0AAF3ECK4_9BILA